MNNRLVVFLDTLSCIAVGSLLLSILHLYGIEAASIGESTKPLEIA